MFLRLFLLFTVIPVIEVMILVRLGESFGFITTLTLVITTGLIGAYLVRKEGFAVIVKIQAEFKEGRFPAEHLLDGILLLVAGIVLVTPGLLTDITGFVLLIPFTRDLIKRVIQKKLSEAIKSGTVHVHQGEFLDKSDEGGRYND